MAKIQFENGVTVDFEGTPTEADIEEVSSKFSKPLEKTSSFAERSSQFIQRPEIGLPLAPVFGAPLARKVAEVLPIAEKRYPAEELLPQIGGISGGIAGSIATLPSGGGVPFGATLGAGAGGAAGQALRKGVRALRGKPSDDANILGEGIKQAGYELGGGAIFKIGRAFGIKELARKGLGKFADKIKEIVKPKELERANELFEKFKDKSASMESDTKEFIEDFLKSRGITYKPSAEAIRQRMQKEALEPVELAQLSQQMEAKAPKLSPELASEPAKQYAEMGNILDDLAKEDLTYGQLKQIQQRVDDLAKFEKSSGRKTTERIFGIVRDKISKDLKRTAEEGGFIKDHDFIMGQRRNIFKERFLKDLIAESSQSVGVEGEKLNFTRMASDLNSYTEDELKRQFGNESKYIFALRDLATEYAGKFPSKEPLRPYVTARGHGGATAGPGFFSRFSNLEKPTAQILQKRLGGIELLPEIITGKNLRRSVSAGLRFPEPLFE